jgi:hypothetical protein
LTYSRKYNSHVPSNVKTTNKPGVNLDSGPYIGIVKANADPLRKGRVSVFIERFGGNENDPENWRTVSYASPFFGQTSAAGKSATNSYANSVHSYGMWATPPDIGVKILCVFVNGDPNTGYYIGCLPDANNHFSVPGHASTTNVTQDDKGAYKFEKMPGAEFNDKGDSSYNSYDTNPRPSNPILTGVLKWQGLMDDDIRGHTTSSSKRESPSRVFGISTPGRPIPDLPVTDIQNTGSDNPPSQKIKTGVFRMPGHSFVMDDGELGGDNNLIRLKSASGHQILMHDTEGIIYISNNTGTAWMEFGVDGKIDVFSAESISYNAKKDFNITAGRSINMQAGEQVNIISDSGLHMQSESLNLKGVKETNITGLALDLKALGSIKVSADASIGIKSAAETSIKGSILNLNSSTPSSAKEVKSAKFNTHPAPSYTGNWKAADTKQSIATRVPQHEPYDRSVEKPVQSTTPRKSANEFSVQVATPPSSVQAAGQPSVSKIPGYNEGMSSAIQTVSANFTGVVKEVETKIAPITPAKILQDTTNIVNELFDDVGELSSEILSSIEDFVKEQSLIKHAEAAIASVTELAENTIDAISSTVGDVVNSVTGTVGDVVDSVSDTVSDIVDGSGLSELTSGLGDFVENVASGAGEFVQGMGGVISDIGNSEFVSNITSDFSAAAEQFSLSDLGSGLGNVITTVSDVTGKFLSDTGISKFVNDFTSSIDISVVDIIKQQVPYKEIAVLSIANSQKLLATLGKTNGPSEYELVTADGEVGKYNFTVSELQQLGYIKPGPVTNLSPSGVWTGKDGVNSVDAFLTSSAIQESAAIELLDANGKQMEKTGAIKPTDSQEVAAGMLAVSKKAGPATAAQWRTGQVVDDTLDAYYVKANSVIKNTTTG